MDAKKLLDPLQKLGVPISPKALLIIGIVLPLAILLGAAVWKWWQKRKTHALAPPSAVVGVGDAAAAPSLLPSQLRKAWLRFLRALPRTYRRSILNFEHFVVLGEPGSGKSRVIDTFTDWRRQAKQFLGSQAFDADMQVYLGSQAVVTELPAKVLLDLGPGCAKALRALWRPLYRARSPTVVVVLDIERLKATPPELIADSAERVRGKLNLLSAIRRRSLEVRLVLTHLDASEGFEQYAEFCREEKIPLYIPLRCDPSEPPLEQQLIAWTERARDHLARALVKLDAGRFRQVIAFLRRTPEIPKPLAHFVGVLFAKEALSRMPELGGVYLSSAAAAGPSPLVGDGDSAGPPDPRGRHVVLSTVLACTALPYMAVAFGTQHGLYKSAERALKDYKPSMVGTQTEMQRRAAITAFASQSLSPTEHVPNFFAAQRAELRAQAADRVRFNLLVPNLNKVAQDGAIEDSALKLRWRRALFYLSLIHSDKHDVLRILDPERLQIWAHMTELPPVMIHDYLELTDAADRTPVDFNLGAITLDEHDGVAFWTSFLRDVARASSEPAIDARSLLALQARASEGAESLDRFRYDDIAGKILGSLDDAASVASTGREAANLSAFYKPKFQEMLANVAASDVFGQRERASAIFRAIRSASIEQPAVDRVDELADRLLSLYSAPLETAASSDIVLKIAGEPYTFEGKRWAELIRNSRASQLVAGFMRNDSARGSIFFLQGAEREFQAVRRNPTNDGTAIFVGSASIEGVYTRPAYEKLIAGPVLRLAKALEAATLAPDQRSRLEEFVAQEVKRYAVQYAQRTREFYQSFALATPSSAALRAAVAQMVAEQSPFSAFVRVIDTQTTAPAPGPMLAPMARELTEFAYFHKLVDASSGAPELDKYKAILAQLLVDLGPPPEDDKALADEAEPAAASEADTLEHALTHAGRLALLNLRAEKGSYGSLVAHWLASVQVPVSQRSPFLWPVYELDRLGRGNIAHVVSEVWTGSVRPDIDKLSHRFPFDPHGAEDAMPREIDALINPSTGRLFVFFNHYLRDLSDSVQPSGRYRPRESVETLIRFPEDLYDTLNAAAALSRRLYDEKGAPAPLPLRVATVPFDHGIDPRTVLTLEYLTVGEASIYNFNQRPGLSTIRVDWTREQVAQVGLQYTNLDTQETLFPDPVATASSHWSLLRLLVAGESQPIKRPQDAELVTWRIRRSRDSQDSTPVRFVVVGNPLAAFSLGQSREPLAARSRFE